MRSGKFDAIVGNPPYIRIHNLVGHHETEVRYIQEKYSTASFGKVDIYVAFVEQGLKLLKESGLLGLIVPSKFMQADYGVGLRRLIIFSHWSRQKTGTCGSSAEGLRC